MLNRIAVAVDGTEESLRAVEHVCKLAKVHGSDSVTLVSVIPTMVYSDADFDPVKEHGEQQLEMIEPAVKILDDADVPGEVVLLHGRPADEIARYANEADVDLLAVGTRALNKLRAATTGGSVSRKVAKQAKCPILIVG